MTQAKRGGFTTRFRDLDVEISYEIDGGEADWWFDEPELNKAPITSAEAGDLADEVWEHSFT